ncbi:hypothetical protein [Candidatus Ichthyocystis sparus]|uniref:hypothetical protein n=1 Tax=Candidatus Ichthyocystis sparus TaxID=1561004 RepID=UPI0011476454|nr:hypothetical protein [Candidatus Ichthyocystis sparus]
MPRNHRAVYYRLFLLLGTGHHLDHVSLGPDLSVLVAVIISISALQVSSLPPSQQQAFVLVLSEILLIFWQGYSICHPFIA